ncbi:transcription factor bHLH75-like isoform X1 [Spinacia oleracea]|uniref:Transcription factor bHLH75-like isoform X1 n=1 Tax=Spinacia oleracea TaxID=3562 RepID=A0ABM3QUC1_SPIOL|nr:transcription factor bHLH75-like isoform X1 [Spinacia oleracea]
MSASPFLCVVDDDGHHPHLQTTLHPADNHYASSSSINNLNSNFHSDFSCITNNFTTFEEFSQCYNDIHQQYHEATNVANMLTAVSENTNTTFSPKGIRQNAKGRQRNRRNEKKEDNNYVVERTSLNMSKKAEERRIYDDEDAAGCRDGCVYVRAKRGQAIDSHSLAERVRRQKISDKMKLLQSLVPGCDKAGGKIPVLDNIIDYIHSLQDQVESLATEVALVDPTFDVNYLAVESAVTQTEISYGSGGGSECSRITSQYQSIPLNGTSTRPLPSPWLALLEDREYTI